MDDFLIMAPTRWSLRRAVRDLNRLMAEYGFPLHPDKTQLGYTTRGFDWMGLWFTQGGIQSIASRARNKHLQQCRWRYEQIRSLNQNCQETRMAQYRRRWFRALVPPHAGLVLDSVFATPPAYDALLANSAPRAAWGVHLLGRFTRDGLEA